MLYHQPVVAAAFCGESQLAGILAPMSRQNDFWRAFHYGVCYFPEHWDARRHSSDIRRIAKAGFNYVRMGEGAWSYWEPREGKFQFDLFDRVVDLCDQHGLNVIFGTPTYAAPAWVACDYPEVLRWNFQRVPMAHGSRRNLNYTSPKYMELSDRLVTALAEHYANHPRVIAWQLDNEFNCHMNASYAPSDTLAFRAWLKDKYGTIDRLNDAWGTRFWSQTYDRWEQIDLPRPTATYLNPSVLLDESRFISACVVRFAARQATILHSGNPKWKITHNGLFSNLNGPDLVRQLDFFCHDQYPLFNKDWLAPAASLAQARSLSEPFGILEQQAGPGGQMEYLQRTPRPGEMRLWAWQCILHGARMLSYFRWRTVPYGSEQHWHGLLDPDNLDNRRLAEAGDVAREIEKIPEEFWNATLTRCVAVWRNFDDEVNEGRINTYVGGGGGEYWRWLNALSRRHFPGDFVWSNDSQLDRRLESYRLLIAPHPKLMTAATVKSFTRFVKNGGTLVLCAQAGLKDENCHLAELTPPGLLRELAGVEVEDWTTLAAGETRLAHDAGPAKRCVELSTFVERLRCLKGTEVLATWAGDDSLLGEAPAITRRAVGAGAVWYVGGYCPAPAVESILEILAVELELSPITGTGAQIELISRGQGRRRWIGALNHSGVPQPLSELPEARDLFSGATVAGSAVLPPWGVAIYEVNHPGSR